MPIAQLTDRVATLRPKHRAPTPVDLYGRVLYPGTIGRPSMNRTISVFLLIGFALGCNEIKEESFATHGDARKRNAVERGLVPACVPEQATSIRSAFDFATNEQWIRFELRPEHLADYQTDLGDRLGEIHGPRVSRPSGVTWWPDELVGALDERELAQYGYTLRGWPHPATKLVAIRANDVFCWSAPR